jgi:hypothetical protein
MKKIFKIIGSQKSKYTPPFWSCTLFQDLQGKIEDFSKLYE